MAQAGLVKKRDFHHVSATWNVMMNIIAGLFALICVFPFIFVVIISFTDEKVLARDGYRLIPAEWSFAAYQFVWQSGDTLLRAYGVTILVTVLGTIISLVLM